VSHAAQTSKCPVAFDKMVQLAGAGPHCVEMQTAPLPSLYGAGLHCVAMQTALLPFLFGAGHWVEMQTALLPFLWGIGP